MLDDCLKIFNTEFLRSMNCFGHERKAMGNLKGKKRQSNLLWNKLCTFLCSLGFSRRYWDSWTKWPWRIDPNHGMEPHGIAQRRIYISSSQVLISVRIALWSLKCRFQGPCSKNLKPMILKRVGLGICVCIRHLVIQLPRSEEGISSIILEKHWYVLEG